MQSIDLESRTDGVIVPVRAKPAARRNALEGVHDGALRISVTAAPEKGKANKAICALLAKSLGESKSQVEIIAGETTSKKRLLIHGQSPDQVRLTLEQLLPAD